MQNRNVTLIFMDIALSPSLKDLNEKIAFKTCGLICHDWTEIRGNVQSFIEALWMDGCRRKHLVSGLYCLLNRPEMGEQ